MRLVDTQMVSEAPAARRAAYLAQVLVKTGAHRGCVDY